MEKIRIPEPHKFKFGGGSWGDAVNYVKIHFFENITKERAEEIAKELMSHITKD